MKILEKKIVLVLIFMLLGLALVYGGYCIFTKKEETKDKQKVENVLEKERYINLSTMTYDVEENILEKKFLVVWKQDYSDEIKNYMLTSKIKFNFELKRSQLKNSDFIIFKNKENYKDLQIKLFETGLFKTVEMDIIVKPM